MMEDDSSYDTVAREHRDDNPTMSQVSHFSLMPTTQTTTVTTTTTVATKFPPVVFKKPRKRLNDWDPTSYPLKDTPTPVSLRRFTFDLDGRPATFVESADTDQALIELQSIMGQLQSNAANTVVTQKVSTGSTGSKDTFSARNPQSKLAISDVRKRPQDETTTVPTPNKRRNVSQAASSLHLSEDRSIPTIAPQPTRPCRSSEHIMTTDSSEGQSTNFPAQEDSKEKSGSHEPATPNNPDLLSPRFLSLPSPSASPITAGNTVQETADLNNKSATQSSIGRSDRKSLDTILEDHQQAVRIMGIPSILETFDDLPQNVQSYLMYQLLRRCNKTTLQVVAEIVNPALKRDFLDLLPYELSLHVLSYLDAKALTRAAQVSRRWRQIVDEDEYTWKNRLECDQYYVEDAEFEWAIDQGRENQIQTRRLSAPPESAMRSSPSAPIVVKGRFEEMVNGGLKQPLVGQHIYKTIYKQHHVDHQAWMNPRHKPRHISFESHGRHVVTCLQLDGDKIITGSEDANINIFDIKSGNLLMTLEGHEGGVWALHFLGQTLVSGSTDRTIRVWNMTTGLCMQVFEGHTSTVRCLQILPAVECTDPDHPYVIITGSRDSSLRVWKLPNADDPIFPTALSPEGQPVEERNPYYVRALVGHSQSVRAIVAELDILVSGSYDCTVRVWSISTGRCLHKLTGHTEKVYSVVLDTKQNRCISGSMDWKVKIWDLDNGNCLFTLNGHTSLVGLLNLSHERLVSAAADFTLRVWDPKNGYCSQVLAAHTGAITCFQHDGDKVISGSDGTLKLWDIKTGKFCRDLLTGLSYVWQVRFDSRRCVAAVQRNAMTFIEVLDFGTLQDQEAG